MDQQALWRCVGTESCLEEGGADLKHLSRVNCMGAIGRVARKVWCFGTVIYIYTCKHVPGERMGKSPPRICTGWCIRAERYTHHTLRCFRTVPRGRWGRCPQRWQGWPMHDEHIRHISQPGFEQETVCLHHHTWTILAHSTKGKHISTHFVLFCSVQFYKDNFSKK